MANVEGRAAAVVVSLEPEELGVLQQLAAEMRLLLEADIPQSDAVMSRLFPDAHDDPAEARAYREITGDELRTAKLHALNTVDDLLEQGPVVLSGETLEAWLTLLTDMRLAIGTRLDITEEKMERPIDPDDPEGPALAVLGWLGWLQGSTLEALDEEED